MTGVRDGFKQDLPGHLLHLGDGFPEAPLVVHRPLERVILRTT